MGYKHVGHSCRNFACKVVTLKPATCNCCSHSIEFQNILSFLRTLLRSPILDFSNPLLNSNTIVIVIEIERLLQYLHQDLHPSAPTFDAILPKELNMDQTQQLDRIPVELDESHYQLIFPWINELASIFRTDTSQHGLSISIPLQRIAPVQTVL